MSTVELNSENFEQTITENDFVIVDYWAPWCGPCQSFGPHYEEISERYDNYVFAKVNTETEQELAASFQIRSIPTLMIFREQVIIYAQPGALMGGQLEQLITQASELDMDEVRQQIAEQESESAEQEGVQAEQSEQ